MWEGSVLSVFREPSNILKKRTIQKESQTKKPKQYLTTSNNLKKIQPTNQTNILMLQVKTEHCNCHYVKIYRKKSNYTGNL